MGHFFSLPFPSRKRRPDTSSDRPHSELTETAFKRPRTEKITETKKPESSKAAAQRWDTDDCRYGEKSEEYLSQQVFLSHSGKQKNFVEQLYTDLDRENISCFFDKDPQSLPKGEDFPSRIFKAAAKCRVAVVVLTEDFISSKWPMQELCAFVKAKRSGNPGLKILPLFFGISSEALSQKIQNNDFPKSWDILQKSQKRIDPAEWVDALKALRPINGVNYIEGEGEVAYRRQIIGHIRRLLPPGSKDEGSDVQGKERLCQEVAKLFDMTPCSENGVKVAGLYGAGGTGKTTICRIICNFYCGDFEGRVSHVELQRKSAIKPLKHALRIFTDASETLLHSVTSEDHGFDLLKERMPGRRVLLALDNVSDDSKSLKDAQKYLNAVCSGTKSMVLLTARSSTILKRFIPEIERSFMHVPCLQEEEAIAVLLQLTPVKMSNLTSADRDVLRMCIQKCSFRWYREDRDYKPFHAFHPLGLQTLGAYLYDKFDSCTEPSRWNIDIPNMSNTRGSHLEKIFCIFEESLELLSVENRNVFMLSSLYLPNSDMDSEDILNWLAYVCNKEVEDVEYFIIQLKRKGFLERGRKGELYVHDLLKDFAASKADGKGKWISLKETDEIPPTLQQALSNDRPRFEFVKFEKFQFQSGAILNTELLGNVLVLHLQNLPNLKTLNLKWMKIVRSITIRGCDALEEIQGLENLRSLGYCIVEGCFTEVKCPGIGCLTALRHLQVHLQDSNQGPSHSGPAISFPPLPIEEAGSSEVQEYPKLKGFDGPLDLTQCSKLQNIQLSWCGITLLDVTGCSKLRAINLVSCNNLISRSLDFATFQLFNLTNLRLAGLQSLERIPSLDGLSNLINLNLEIMQNLEELPSSLRALPNLRNLRLLGLRDVKELPNLGGLTKLTHLRLAFMPHVKEIPSLNGLINLSDLWLQALQNAKTIPSLHGLTNLTYLALKEMPNVEQISGLDGLTNLIDFCLQRMRSLKSIPRDLGRLSNISYLSLEGMRNVEEIPNLSGLTYLITLTLEGMPNVEDLPTLNGLHNLSDLILLRMPKVKELPALEGLTQLHGLTLDGMQNVKKLPNLAGLTNLTDLWLHDMQYVKEMPSLDGLTNLTNLTLIKCGMIELPDLSNCLQLETIRIDNCELLSKCPNFSGLSALKFVQLARCKRLVGRPNVLGCPLLRYVKIEDNGHTDDDDEVDGIHVLS